MKTQVKSQGLIGKSQEPRVKSQKCEINKKKSISYFGLQTSENETTTKGCTVLNGFHKLQLSLHFALCTVL